MVVKKRKILSFQNDGEEGERQLVNWKFDQELCRKAVARMIITDELPFKFVEHEGFRYFFSGVQPKFELLSHTTVARDCWELYASEEKKLKNVLGSPTQRVCLTTDLWNSLQNTSYICLTAHFIDRDWKLHKRILNFCVIHSPEGVAVGQAIESCMLQWGIEKVLTITVDNASFNDASIANSNEKVFNKDKFVLDGEFFHVRCCATILNFIVRDGIEEVKDSISRICGVVKYIRRSSQRAQQFKTCCEQEEITSKSSLCLDVPTTWNYTYVMLESALKFQKAFERLNEQEPHFASNLKVGVPSERDWDNARVLTKFLRTFYYVTKRLSGSLYVTSNSYFHEVCAIEQVLCDWSNSSDPCLSVMAMKMKEKFDKYWGNIDKVNMMLFIAVVLDPRFKLKYVKFYYTKISPSDKVNELVRKIKELMDRLYVHYQMLDSTSSVVPNRMTQGSNEMEVINDACKHVRCLKAEFLRYLEQEELVDTRSEVDRYLEESIVKDTDGFEILDWWKFNSSRYQILSQIARDVLAIPASTVASASSFSMGGRVLNQFHSSLTPKLVECLICTQDWLRASHLPIEVEKMLGELEDLESVDFGLVKGR